MSRLVETLQRFVNTEALTGPGLVAVSGGADSVALLLGLLECGVERLVIGHFNHRLRGDESDGDEQFVRDLGKRLGVPVRVGSADVAAAGGNLEATARRLRYDWLGEVANEVGAAWVATGHTADDQAETVLHRIIRGTGIQGLRGVAETRMLTDEIALVRPLLNVRRAAILDYLAEKRQPFRTDSTNADPAFTRNRIRQELLPLLATYNPAIVDILGRLANQAFETFHWLECDAERWLRECEKPRAGETIVLAIPSTTLPTDVVLREMLRLIGKREQWPLDSMTAGHWDHVVQIVRGTAAAADFPGRVHVRRVGNVVQLHRRA